MTTQRLAVPAQRPWLLSLLLVFLVLGLVACGDDDPGTADTGGAHDVDGEADGDEPGPSADADDGADSGDAVPGDVGDGGDTDAGDTTPDPPRVLPELVTQAPFEAPADPLADSELESCAVFQETRCHAGVVQRCNIFDPGAGDFVEEPDPLLRRAFLFDRWRDLFTSPVGQAIDRDFIDPMLPGTPEEEWTSLDRFKCYCGTGDGGIWTGWATVAAVLRYTQTGTEADYERMEQQVRDLVTMFDVTGVTGYLSRYHYLLMPAGAPKTDEVIQHWDTGTPPGHHHRAIVDVESLTNLPAIYTEGITDDEGVEWIGQPMWQGRPSIDQYTGPMTAFPMAWGLLRDEALKERMAEHLTCYLKRLQRVELINLQSNQELLDTLISYFAAGELLFDEGDLDLTSLDRIVGYVQVQLNTKTENSRDWSCPETVQREPSRVIDATSPAFLLDILEFINDMDTNAERKNTFDHYYFPSIRGGDAMHLMHLAATAYHFTGDDDYRRFLYEDLIEDIMTIRVADTAGAFQMPKYCRTYYGDQITYGPWWSFIELLGEGELRTAMEAAFHNELWSKHLNETANVDLAVMVAGMLPPEIATDRDEAIALVNAYLPLMGGNGGALMEDPMNPVWFDDPKRTYSRTPEIVLQYAPEGTGVVCPTPEEEASCTATITYAGIELPGVGDEARTCTGHASECPVGDADKCLQYRTNQALPPPLRRSTDFLWQRDPFAVGESTGQEGWRQFSGTDYSEPYWNARRYGLLTAGAGQVLAWEDTGSCDD